MARFYGIDVNQLPVRIGLTDIEVPVRDLPPETHIAIHDFMVELERMHDRDPLAFETTIGYVAHRIAEYYGQRAS